MLLKGSSNFDSARTRSFSGCLQVEEFSQVEYSLLLLASSLSRRSVSFSNCLLIMFIICVMGPRVVGGSRVVGGEGSGAGLLSGSGLVVMGMWVGWDLVTIGELIVDTLPRLFLHAVGSKIVGLLALPLVIISWYSFWN